MNFSLFIFIVFYILVFAASGYALIVHQKLEKELKMLSWWLIITGALHLIAFVLFLAHKNNLYVLHVLVPARFFLLLLVYKQILQPHFQSWMLVVFGGGFVLYSLLNSLFLEPVNSFNSNAMTVESVLLVILSISAYILLLNKQEQQKLKVSGRSVVWFNGGVFLYYTSSLILMYFGDYIIRVINAEWSRYIWLMHGFFMVILYYCFWRALWDRKTT